MMNRKVNKFFYVLVHVLEYFIAVMTIVVLIGLLGYEVYKMITVNGYFTSADTYLKNMLTIVVGF